MSFILVLFLLTHRARSPPSKLNLLTSSSIHRGDTNSVEIHMTSQSDVNVHDPGYIASVAASTDLSLLVTKDKNWPAAAVRCRTHPAEAAEALEVKVRGAYTARITPLHFACEHRPSAEVVSALVAACPAALERRQEPGGQLPLHAACTWGASGPAVAVMLDSCPGAAERKDFLSNLPLHCACYSGASAGIVEGLLRAYPQGVWPRNHQGSAAADIVRRLNHPNKREVLALLEGTMARLLRRKKEEAMEAAVERGGNLEWV